MGDKLWPNGTWPDMLPNIVTVAVDLAADERMYMSNEGEDEHTPIETVQFDPLPILTAIVDEARRLQQMGYDPDFILFGEEEFSRLARVAFTNHIYSFEVPHIAPRGSAFRGMFHGMEIRVSPTIRGYCVVPKARR